MATALREIAPAETETVPTSAMVLAEPAKGTVVLLDRQKFETFFEATAQKARAFVPDVTTNKGREALKSFVFQEVVKVRTGLEGQANALTEEWRKNTNAVVKARNEITERFKVLAEEVRRPLTEWEAKEELRKAACQAVIDRLTVAGQITHDDTAATIMERGCEVKDTVITADQFAGQYDEAVIAQKMAFDALRAAYVAKVAAEKAAKEAAAIAEQERIELEQLRAEKAERDRLDEEKRVAEEARLAAVARAEVEERNRRAAAERAEQERRDAEARVEEARLAELERIAQAEREAEARARREAEEAAQAERDRIAEAHALELAAANAERDRVERDAREAQARRDAEEAARIAEAEKLAAEAAERTAADQARARNQAHRVKIRTAIEHAFMARGADDVTAHAIVSAIIGGEIAHVSVAF